MGKSRKQNWVKNLKSISCESKRAKAQRRLRQIDNVERRRQIVANKTEESSVRNHWKAERVKQWKSGNARAASTKLSSQENATRPNSKTEI